MELESILKVVDIKKHYGDVKAVDGISFELHEGEVLGVLGPNGAGKTTTVEMLEGLRKPDSGEIWYFGKKMSKIGLTVKENIGVQLQTSAFLEHLTVRETLEMFRGLYKKSLPTNDLIDMVALKEKEKSRVKGLSGGQLQRLAIAAALVNDPKIVFLDEPTTGLDPQARRMLWNTIEGLKEKKKTIILTTHYMEEAEVLADRIIIVDHGKVIARGTLDDLRNSLHQDSFVEFSINHKELPGSFTEVEAIRTVGENRYCIPTKDVEKTISKVFGAAKISDTYIENLVIRKANLEDVFLTMTGHSLRD